MHLSLSPETATEDELVRIEQWELGKLKELLSDFLEGKDVRESSPVRTRRIPRGQNHLED